MNLYGYIKDKGMSILLHIMGMLAVSAYMRISGSLADTVVLLLMGWGMTVILYYFFDFRARKRYYQVLLEQMDQLDQKYLIADLMKKPYRAEDLIYYHMLRQGNKAMLEEISEIRQEYADYTEYMEQWVHEVKTPLAAMKLICENNRSEETRKVLRELERAGRCVEQVLFFARSKNVEKDYLIREVNLTDIVTKAIQNNKQLLIEKKVQVKTDCDQNVFTDHKWITFIIDQCILNSVQYGAGTIIFRSQALGSKTHFYIQDDGMGITKEDLPRIFEKGFTGKNGHEQEQSTGMGLFLCKKLCDKLDVLIGVESEPSKYTKIILTFSTGGLEDIQ